jgi:hypothetical protein
VLYIDVTAGGQLAPGMPVRSKDRPLLNELKEADGRILIVQNRVASLCKRSDGSYGQGRTDATHTAADGWTGRCSRAHMAPAALESFGHVCIQSLFLIAASYSTHYPSSHIAGVFGMSRTGCCRKPASLPASNDGRAPPGRALDSVSVKRISWPLTLFKVPTALLSRTQPAENSYRT